MVVDGDGEDLLGLLLADDVLAELVVDLLGGRDALAGRSCGRIAPETSSSMISRHSSTHSSQM